MAALSVDVRRKSFPAVGDAPEMHVLRGLRLQVATGETLAVTGPSGCGKTTLLNLVAGLDLDFDGEVAFSTPGRIGYVFQEPRLLPWRTVADNLRLVLPDADPKPAIVAALAEVGLSDAAEVYASRLSLGMARRAALARAFVIDPSFLLLDEPFVSLDAPTAARLRLLLLDLLDHHETAALFVTHNLREAVMLADRIVVLSPPPACVVGEAEVGLTRAERRDPAALAAAEARLLGADGPLAHATDGGPVGAEAGA